MGYQHGPCMERTQMSKLGRTKPKLPKIACMVFSLTTNFLLIIWAKALGGREKRLLKGAPLGSFWEKDKEPYICC